ETFCLSPKLLNTFTGHTSIVNSIDSIFNYHNISVLGHVVWDLDKSICLWDIRSSQQIQIFSEHIYCVNTVEYSPFLVDNIETVQIVKYGSNELVNAILSGSADKSVRLWDIRSGQQIQVFNGHLRHVNAVECSPFVINDSSGNSNVICSGSWDNTIRFWDIRSNKNELYMIKGDDKEDNGIYCLKFIVLKKKEKTKNVIYNLNLCYGLFQGTFVFGDNLLFCLMRNESAF
ncbi:hypothetical protein RFI_30836, partial [Reticulomyxa filosa]